MQKNISINTVAIKRSKKDYESDQEVRWCPGCGDYAILASVQKVLAELQKKPEDTVFISGIGCASRFPYYINSYGFHTIHGRAPTIATGLKLMRPELDIWIVTGDGDALSIGLGHIMHLMRRNVDVTILMMNNRIYGLTKGQYSPTSKIGSQTKSSPLGSQDSPLDPIKVAMAADCGFVARAIDIDSVNLQEVIKAANAHKGTSFVEIYQNCNVFNDGAFADISQRELRDEKTIQLRPNQPMLFGKNKQKGLTLINGQLRVIDVNESNAEQVLIFEPKRMQPYVLQLLEENDLPVPLGIFCANERETLKSQANNKLLDSDELNQLIAGKQSWVVA